MYKYIFVLFCYNLIYIVCFPFQIFIESALQDIEDASYYYLMRNNR